MLARIPVRDDDRVSQVTVIKDDDCSSRHDVRAGRVGVWTTRVLHDVRAGRADVCALHGEGGEGGCMNNHRVGRVGEWTTKALHNSRAGRVGVCIRQGGEGGCMKDQRTAW